MPIVSMFYGLIVSLYFMDNKKHHRPHIHVRYQGQEGVFAIPEGEQLEGSLPPGKIKLLLAWMEIHKEELIADWELAEKGEPVFRIDPLK